MAVTSFPWTPVGSDRTVTAAMDAAYFAATHGNIVLTGLAPSLDGTDVEVSPGTAIVQGRVVTVDTAVTLTPVINRRARIVLRLDIENRTAEVALSGTTTSYPSLTRTGATWELGLGTVDTTAATTVADTRADFDLCGTVDTGWLTNQMTAVEGWQINDQALRRSGNVVMIRLIFERTGSTISVPADGNIVNSEICALPDWAVPLYHASLAPSSTGPVCSGTVSPVSRGVSLAAVGASTVITSGTRLSLGGTYIVG